MASKMQRDRQRAKGSGRESFFSQQFRVHQIITLFSRDTLEHNIALSLLGLSKERWKAFSRFSKDIYRSANEILRLVGLQSAAGRLLSEVSYGDKRRVEIAMALAQKPKVLLLDEPLAGLSR